MVKKIVFLAAALAPLSGCSAETPQRTELLLVADTNIAHVDKIKFEIKGPTGAARTAEASAGPKAPGPRSLGLLYTDGKLGPFTLSAAAFDGDTFVVSRSAKVSFVKGRTLVVPLHLVSSCIGVMCENAGDTCTERGCEASALDASDLQPWSGSAPRLPAQPGGNDGGWVNDDASGPHDAGRDAAMLMPDAALMLCDGGAVDLMSDEGHCGDCGTACGALPADQHADNRCLAGLCKPVCQDNYGDCDRLIAGCESDLRAIEHCKTCTVRCVGNRTCTNGICIK